MSEEKPKEGVKTENDHINLKVAGQDGSVVQFKIKRHTPLSKLMKAYCERQGLSMRQIRFRFDGQPINETDTPAQWTCGQAHQQGGSDTEDIPQKDFALMHLSATVVMVPSLPRPITWYLCLGKMRGKKFFSNTALGRIWGPGPIATNCRRRCSDSTNMGFSPFLNREEKLTLNPPEGIVAGPMNEENFFEWEALIMGPEDTCFEFGVFPAILSFPLDYPLSPPKMRFTCEMFHPNIYPDGRVCISILHAPGDDPMGYESSAERWSPVQSVEKILLSVVSMLAEPNDESGANVDASKMWRDDREQFYKVAKQIVQKSLGL
ncbi:hypothetical protein E5288_WYG011037 [Bos mutus]|uniref:Ubiquitin-conjugating enzyme E2 G2 n=4 Tax=Artiodactyla TaxID=91561 RepID=A0A6B0QYE4_9CETA|nr:hypothetical protein [Bos mutus]